MIKFCQAATSSRFIYEIGALWFRSVQVQQIADLCPSQIIPDLGFTKFLQSVCGQRMYEEPCLSYGATLMPCSDTTRFLQGNGKKANPGKDRSSCGKRWEAEAITGVFASPLF